MSNTDDAKITLKVKSTSNASGNDFQIKANLNETVKELGNRILSELNVIGKGIRLISAGKMLQPPTAKLNELNLLDGSYVHAVVSDINPGNNFGSNGSNILSETSSPSTTSMPPIILDRSNLRGLDRLMNDGLSIDELAAIRSVFRQQIDAYALIVPRNVDEDVNSHLARVEDRWMQSQSAVSEFAINLPPRGDRRVLGIGDADPLVSAFPATMYRVMDYADEGAAQGTVSDFVWGCLMGSTLGFIMIFCIWDRNISYRQKMGILLGVTTHMLLSSMGQINKE